VKRFYPITVHNGCPGCNSGIRNRVSTNQCVRSHGYLCPSRSTGSSLQYYIKYDDWQGTSTPHLTYEDYSLLPYWVQFILGLHTVFETIHCLTGSWDTAVGTATGYGLEGQGFRVRVRVGSRIFSALPRPDRFLGLTQPLIQRVPGCFPRGKVACA
jgi:hypothetical protein